MKKTAAGVISAVLMILSSCMMKKTDSIGSATFPETIAEKQSETEKRIQEEEEMILKMKINDSAVEVEWQENESVYALKELCRNEPLVIRMSMYGGFEQVGPIGSRLPSEDVPTVTDSGDIVLYSGNQIVVFYGSNSWAYTRLGHVTDKNRDEMKDLLGNENVIITLSLQEAE